MPADQEITDDGTGKVATVLTNKGENIPCQFVGLTVGVSPNIEFLKNTALHINKGIVVNESLETNIPDVYAIGDCAEIQNPQPGRRPIEAVWYTGRMMGEAVAHNACGKPVHYNPGVWFNSAKFFNIEYQVYGDIKIPQPENYTSLYWEHPQGKKSIRIVFDKFTGAIIGFNLMGVRYRHEVCNKWIKSQTHIEQVLQNLGLANFDPEFFKQYEQELVNTYNQKTGKSLKLNQNRSLNAVLKFLRA